MPRPGDDNHDGDAERHGWIGDLVIAMEQVSLLADGRYLYFEGAGHAAVGLPGTRIFVRDLLTREVRQITGAPALRDPAGGSWQG